MATVHTAAQVTLINHNLSIELGCDEPMEQVQLQNAYTSVDGISRSVLGKELEIEMQWQLSDANLWVCDGSGAPVLPIHGNVYTGIGYNNIMYIAI